MSAVPERGYPDRSRTHVVLDWDGVINLRRRYRAFDIAESFSTDPTGENRRIVVRYRPDVVAALNILIAELSAEFFWLTSNGYLVPSLWAPRIGLAPVESSWNATVRPGGLGYPSAGSRSMTWWKARAIRRHLEDADRVMWIDDHLTADLRAELASARDAARLSWIVPDSADGLLLEHVGALDEWLHSPADRVVRGDPSA